MRKIQTVLRLFHEAGLTQRAIARSQEIARSTVANYLTRASNAGLSWPLPPELDERALELALFPESDQALAHKQFIEPDYSALHIDLKSAMLHTQQI
jgi:DNA-binding MarR family transcriptional regulator